MVMVTKGHAPGSGTGNWSQMSVHTLEGIWRKPGLPRPETGLPGWLSPPVLANMSLNYSPQHVRSPRDPGEHPSKFPDFPASHPPGAT